MFILQFYLQYLCDGLIANFSDTGRKVGEFPLSGTIFLLSFFSLVVKTHYLGSMLNTMLLDCE